MNKIAIKKFLSKGLNIQLVRSPHKGIELGQDISDFLPDIAIEVVFDVGANVGDSAVEYRQWFPKAKLYCFEPVSSTFDRLRANTNNIENIHLEKTALGAEDTTSLMTADHKKSFLNRAVQTEHAGNINDSENSDEQYEEVSVTSLDSYCKEHGIQNIDLLKIDTEGAELQVLKGASQLLSDMKIGLVQVECGMSPINTWHVPFETLKVELERYGYTMFALYEQVGEWKLNLPSLRRVNAVFMSQKLNTAKETINR